MLYELAAGGKPSTRFPPGRLVELISMTKSTASNKREKNHSYLFLDCVSLGLFNLLF